MRNKPWLTWVSATALTATIALFGDGCKKDDNPSSSGGGGNTVTTLNFTTSGQTLNVSTSGGASRAKLTGGTLPYTITSAPTASVATASFSNDTLTVTPVGAGTTSITVQDANPTDTPPRVVTIAITVTGGGGGGGTGIGGNGSMAFNSTQGNFSATGVYDSNATSGQGAGGWRYSQAGAGYLELIAYRVASPTDVSVAYITLRSPSTLATGTYTVGANPNTSNFASWVWAPHVDPNQTTPDFYTLISGTVNLSTLTTGNAQGTFSGTGIYTPNPAQQISVSAGTFNINFVSQGPSTAFEKKIEAIARKMLTQAQDKSR